MLLGSVVDAVAVGLGSPLSFLSLLMRRVVVRMVIIW